MNVLYCSETWDLEKFEMKKNWGSGTQYIPIVINFVYIFKLFQKILSKIYLKKQKQKTKNSESQK